MGLAVVRRPASEARSGVRLASEARSNVMIPVSNAISGVVGAAFDSEQLINRAMGTAAGPFDMARWGVFSTVTHACRLWRSAAVVPQWITWWLPAPRTMPRVG